MPNAFRLAGAAVVFGAVAVAGCNLDVANPAVIDAATFDPTADGQTLSLSAQTNFFIAFQDVAQYGGLISEEAWTGAARAQTKRLSARAFASTDDINADFFAPLSRAIATNENAAKTLAQGSGAATDLNLARAYMNFGYSVELMAETMCQGVIQGGPALSVQQLLDTAITALGKAVTVAGAAGASGASIVNESNVGLARAQLQRGNYPAAIAAAALVPASFQINVLTSASLATQATLGNVLYGTTVGGQLVASPRYRVGDPRLPIDSTSPGATLNGQKYVIQAKFRSYGDPIRLASGLEAQYIAAEAALHASGSTSAALALINARRTAGGQSAYGGATDTLAVISELLNQRARDFWLEGKKLGDLRRNPSVPLSAVLTSPAGTAFYTNGASAFGTTLCVPVPPQETNANPNFTP